MPEIDVFWQDTPPETAMALWMDTSTLPYTLHFHNGEHWVRLLNVEGMIAKAVAEREAQVLDIDKRLRQLSAETSYLQGYDETFKTALSKFTPDLAARVDKTQAQVVELTALVQSQGRTIETLIRSMDTMSTTYTQALAALTLRVGALEKNKTK